MSLSQGGENLSEYTTIYISTVLKLKIPYCVGGTLSAPISSRGPALFTHLLWASVSPVGPFFGVGTEVKCLSLMVLNLGVLASVLSLYNVSVLSLSPN